MIALALSLCAACSNATATVLQRRAARDAPSEDRFRLALLKDLVTRKSWLAGIGALIGGFLFQAAALNFGNLSLVQPVLALELPLTLFIAGRVFGRRMGRRAWLGSAGMALGLVAMLVGLSPQTGKTLPKPLGWIVALGIGAGVIAVLVLTGRAGGSAGAALLGAAAGVGFGLTAALMKGATVRLSSGVAAVFTSWQVYAMVAAGILSVFLVQNALQSGTLVAAQPAVTVADPVTGVALGIVLFHDQVRLGGWLALELVGFAAILLGSIELARSPILANTDRSE